MKNKYIILPHEVMSYIQDLSERDIKILLYWYNTAASKSLEEIKRSICNESCYEEEIVDLCVNKLKTLGLINDIQDTRNIRIQMEKILSESLGSEEKLYKSDFERVYSIIRSNEKPLEILNYAIQLSQNKSSKISLASIELFCKMLIKGDSLEQEYEILLRYVILENGIRDGIPNFKNFTRKDKELLYKWAKANISIDDIYDAYSESIQYTRQISFAYINVILSKKKLYNN